MQLLPEPETSLGIWTIFLSLAVGGAAGVGMRSVMPRLRSLRIPVVAIVGGPRWDGGGRMGGRILRLSGSVRWIGVSAVLGAGVGPGFGWFVCGYDRR